MEAAKLLSVPQTHMDASHTSMLLLHNTHTSITQLDATHTSATHIDDMRTSATHIGCCILHAIRVSNVALYSTVALLQLASSPSILSILKASHQNQISCGRSQ